MTLQSSNIVVLCFQQHMKQDFARKFPLANIHFINAIILHIYNIHNILSYLSDLEIFQSFCSTEKTICFNRGQLGADIFKRKIKKISYERRNLNRLIPYSNENISCNGTIYNVDQLCKKELGLIPILCYIDEIGTTIDM